VNHDNLILMGEFGRAQGLKGEVRVKSYAANPLDLNAYGPLTTTEGRSFTIENLRQAPGGAADILVARVKTITSREAAEKLNRLKLYISRKSLPEPDDEDEFLLADLVGLEAKMQDGDIVGIVINIPNYGGGDLLEIRPRRGKTLLLPFTKTFVPMIDLAARTLIITLPHDDEENEQENGA
jgi:16S rRNA processing protein RimM